MSLAGKWSVTMNTPMGALSFDWEIAKVGDEWRGKMLGRGPIGDSDLSGIRVKGQDAAFETTTPSPMGAIHLEFSGKVAGSTMRGTCRTMFGSVAFDAVRA